MTVWILIFGLHSGMFTKTDFGAISSAEFKSRETCEIALNQFIGRFDTVKDIKAKAICVEK